MLMTRYGSSEYGMIWMNMEGGKEFSKYPFFTFDTGDLSI